MTFCYITSLLESMLESMKSSSCWKRLTSAKTSPPHVTSACQQSRRSSTIIANREYHMQEQKVSVKQEGKSLAKCNCTIFLPLVNEDLRWLCCRRIMFVCFPSTQWQYGHGNALWSDVQNQLTATTVLAPVGKNALSEMHLFLSVLLTLRSPQGTTNTFTSLRQFPRISRIHLVRRYHSANL